MRTNNWTREQLLLVLNLYCKIPFGQFHQGNPEVLNLANLIGRTPGAVAMKLVNFASLDRRHLARGVSGLSNTSKLDREIWTEVTSNWEEFVETSEMLLNQVSPEKNYDESEIFGGEDILTETTRLAKIRVGQRFFRRLILSAYGSCCVCGLPISDFLIASHIIPWRDRKDLRLNPHNGLCLCALHDRAFDKGYMTVLPNYQIIISPVIDRFLPHKVLDSGLSCYHQQRISLPDRFAPDETFLAVHNETYFRIN